MKAIFKRKGKQEEASFLSPESIAEFWGVNPKDIKFNGVKSMEEAGAKLLMMGLISESHYLSKLEEMFGVPSTLLSEKELKEAPVLDLSVGKMRSRRFFPFKDTGDELWVAVADPKDLYIAEVLRKKTGKRIRYFVASEARIEDAINRVYGRDDGGAHQGVPEVSEDDIETLLDLASEAPVVKLVNSIISRAVEEHASDIHIEPLEDEVRVRFRVDGVLNEVDRLQRGLLPAIVSRIKIMARLDIAERRLPQDGRIKTKVAGRDIDIRVATLPTIYGEQVVMRILDQSGVDWSIEKLGLEDDVREQFVQAISSSHGIVLVTGPTGSGKTTTLYSALKILNRGEVKIITVEDPVEYVIPGVIQIQVNPQIGLTFASGLRSIVRQDPDIIMVGEIRDPETADIAIHAALTGHLVLSTLHTNDAASAVTRLIDMGVESFLVASSVIAIMAQRLVRVVCPYCKREVELPEPLKRRFGIEGPVFRGSGCEACKNTGFLGRTGIYELLIVDDEIRKLITQSADSETIKKAAMAKGMRTLLEDGILKVKKGITTIEEVLRVAYTVS